MTTEAPGGEQASAPRIDDMVDDYLFAASDDIDGFPLLEVNEQKEAAADELVAFLYSLDIDAPLLEPHELPDVAPLDLPEEDVVAALRALEWYFALTQELDGIATDTEAHMDTDFLQYAAELTLDYPAFEESSI